MTARSLIACALTRLAALGTLSRSAGEGGPGAKRWVGEGGGAAVMGFLMTCTSATALAEMTPEPMALLQGLDKITARVSKFEAPVGASVHFGTLSIRVSDCERNPPEDPPESAAFLEIDEMRPGEKVAKRLFMGWMFASSPALSALEHPVYDVNVLDCRAASGSPHTTSGSAEGKDAR